MESASTCEVAVKTILYNAFIKSFERSCCTRSLSDWRNSLAAVACDGALPSSVSCRATRAKGQGGENIYSAPDSYSASVGMGPGL
jgi:hypothetical protein